MLSLFFSIIFCTCVSLINYLHVNCTFSDKSKSFNRFEYCEVEEWKWQSINGSLNVESDHKALPQRITSGESIFPDYDGDFLSEVVFLRSSPQDQSFSENRIKILNPTGNAVWENESSLQCSSQDPLQNPARKRGRPKKIKEETSSSVYENHTVQMTYLPLGKKCRGRPRVHPISTSRPTSISKGQPRQRGRPRKYFLGEKSSYLRKKESGHLSKKELENADYVVGMDIL